jgi:uncharacterized protein (TIGR03083 family)
MEVAEHIAALQRDGERLAAAAQRAGPDTPVPTCPGWLVRDLVRHVGGVHRWAAAHVAGPRTEPWNADLHDVVGAWPDDAELATWFRDGHAELVQTLRAADPALQCWTFLRAPSPLAMWARRQAHETAIHRADAELAGGAAASFAPAFAADGVDELLTCFIPRRSSKLRADPPRTLRVCAEDAAGDWLVRIGPEHAETVAGAPGADCEVRGRAAELYLVLWHRLDPDVLTVAGDSAVLELFRDRVRIRWS